MEEEEFVPRKPDYKGDDVAVWINRKGAQEWLTVKVDGMEKALVAFKNGGDDNDKRR
ncbi:MAG: hypothetical protein PHH61_00055 [Candidatus Nanoarchaeia archaeon]|nr:hypothetical protein [Candidatus Nanoarchaeia archaeon]